MHAVGLSSLHHNETPLTSFSISICVSLCGNGVMANCYILPVYSFARVSSLPSHLYLFCPLVLSVSCCFSLSVSLLLSSSLPSSPPPLSTLPPLHSPFLFPHLFSPPSPSLLPLFRLCKVQLGFGAFGLQAWRQEDALSEYALLGSLCVTLYFFALLFLPVTLTYFCSLLFVFLLLYMSSLGRPVFQWVSFFDGGRPSACDITSVLQKTGVSKKSQALVESID